MKLKEYYEKVMQEYRCSNCNRLLFKGKIRNNYHLEIICPRCKNLTIFDRKVIIQRKDK